MKNPTEAGARLRDPRDGNAKASVFIEGWPSQTKGVKITVHQKLTVQSSVLDKNNAIW
jgi:hypothetical protein